MNNRIVGVAFAGVLLALAWFARPAIPDGAALGWYVAGWAIIAAGVAALRSGRLPRETRIRVLVLFGALLLADVCWSQPRLTDVAVIVAAALFVSVFVIFQGHYPLLEYLWLVRFPLVLALVLACLPLIFERLFPNFLSNLLVMRAVDLVLVTLLAVVVARAIAFSADLIVRFGSKRAHVARWQGLERVSSFLVSPVSSALAIPLIWATLERCTSPLWSSLPLVVLGVFLGECVVWSGRWFTALLGPDEDAASSRPGHANRLLKRAQHTHVAWAAHARAQCHSLFQQQPEWIRELQGITLPDVILIVCSEEVKLKNRNLSQRRGSMLFAHFGLSGPVVLNASRHWTRAMDEGRSVRITLNVCPPSNFEDVDRRLQSLAIERPRGIDHVRLVAAADGDAIGISVHLAL
jgi:hypothetical protein